MLVRRATTDDAAAVARVLRAAFAALEPQYTQAAFAATTVDATVVAGRLGEGPTWVAVTRDGVVGTVASVATASGVYVRSMGVVPAARGLGAGAALLDAVETHARVHGAERLYLSTTPFLAAAIALYEKAGFERIPDPPFELHGTPLVTMERWLTKPPSGRRRPAN